MSLVHDALERARQDAARREALARGETPAPRPAPARAPSGAGRWLAGAAAAVLLLSAGFGLATLLRRAPAPVAAPLAPPLSPSSQSQAPDPPPPEGPAATAITPALPVAPLQAGEAGSGHPPTAGTVARRPAPRAPARPAAVGADGVPLELQGIVWNRTSPTAVINGAVLAPGEEVGGWIVVRIEPRTVVLADGEREVELRLSPAQAPPLTDPS